MPSLVNTLRVEWHLCYYTDFLFNKCHFWHLLKRESVLASTPVWGHHWPVWGQSRSVTSIDTREVDWQCQRSEVAISRPKSHIMPQVKSIATRQFTEKTMKLKKQSENVRVVASYLLDLTRSILAKTCANGIPCKISWRSVEQSGVPFAKKKLKRHGRLLTPTSLHLCWWS